MVPPKAAEKWEEYKEQATAHYRQTGEHPHSSPELRERLNDVLREIANAHPMTVAFRAREAKQREEERGGT